MCFAMPLRSAPSASNKSHLQRHAQPARTAHLKVWRESESYWVMRGLRLDSNCEVKVCDKAQRFGSIANGSPLNESRRGALNPAGGTFLGKNGKIKNHVCL